MSADAMIREGSLVLEKRHGSDSVATIERIYVRGRSGAYLCVYPDCSFRRHDPVEMWGHVHGAHHSGHIQHSYTAAILAAGSTEEKGDE